MKSADNMFDKHWVRVSPRLHLNLLMHFCRENSTYAAHYFQGELPN